jgi:hypothetical protein
MKYTIQDLTRGICAVKNDGTIDELKDVLSTAFNWERKYSVGNSSFYFKHPMFEMAWQCSNETKLPFQSVKDFI